MSGPEMEQERAMDRPDDAPRPEPRPAPEPRSAPDPETVERAGAAMAALLADLPMTAPWTRRPTPASRASHPA